MIAFAINSLLIMIGFAVFHWIQEFWQNSSVQVFVFYLILSIFRLWIWTVANADNPDLKTKPRSDAAVGGNLDRKLEGSSEGFLQ